jgi:hypothetical protein
MHILGKPRSEGRLIKLTYSFEQETSEQCARAGQATIAPGRAGSPAPIATPQAFYFHFEV